MMPLAQRRPRARDDVAAGHQPLQPVPVGRRSTDRPPPGRVRARRSRRCRRWPRRRCRRGSATRGRGCRSRRSRPGASPRRSSLDRPPAGLPDAGRAVRDRWCCRSSSCWACRSRCSARCRRSGPRAAERRLLPDRPGDADRPGGEERDPDRRVRRAVARARASVTDAAVEAARIRLRPILMTSLAFILGVMPLVFASGAGQAGRCSVGTAVAGGMAFADVPQPAVHPGAVCGGAVGPGHATTRARFGGGGRCVACHVRRLGWCRLRAGRRARRGRALAVASAQAPAGRVTLDEAVRRALDANPRATAGGRGHPARGGPAAADADRCRSRRSARRPRPRSSGPCRSSADSRSCRAPN